MPDRRERNDQLLFAQEKTRAAVLDPQNLLAQKIEYNAT
jgi:hypothetical protein